MAYMPKRFKYRKVMRGQVKGYAQRGNRVSFGEFGLQALDPGWIDGRQLEAARVAANRATGGTAKIWIRIFPDKPVTAKPAETRMGKGKGAVDHYVAVAKRGRMLFELGGVSEELAREGLRLAAAKLPIPTKVVSRADFFMHTVA